MYTFTKVLMLKELKNMLSKRSKTPKATCMILLYEMFDKHKSVETESTQYKMVTLIWGVRINEHEFSLCSDEMISNKIMVIVA